MAHTIWRNARWQRLPLLGGSLAVLGWLLALSFFGFKDESVWQIGLLAAGVCCRGFSIKPLLRLSSKSWRALGIAATTTALVLIAGIGPMGMVNALLFLAALAVFAIQSQRRRIVNLAFFLAALVYFGGMAVLGFPDFFGRRSLLVPSLIALALSTALVGLRRSFVRYLPFTGAAGFSLRFFIAVSVLFPMLSLVVNLVGVPVGELRQESRMVILSILTGSVFFAMVWLMSKTIYVTNVGYRRETGRLVRQANYCEDVIECGTCSVMELNNKLRAAGVSAEKAEKHLRDILNSMQAFIGVLTPDGTVLEVNASALVVTGLKINEVVGKKFEDTKWWSYSTETQEQIRNIIRRVASGERVKSELNYLTARGDIRAVDFVMSPLYSPDGEVEYLIPSGIDIQDRKAFEGLLIKTQREAEISNQAKSSFLAHMSHELRSPLGIILGFADLALEESHVKEKNDHIKTIRRNAELVLALVDEVLDLGKIEAGRIGIDIGDVRLDKLVEELEVSLGIKARERGLELTFEFEPGTPALVRTDALRLKQILFNVIGNAVKYTERGGVRCIIRHLVGGGEVGPLIEFEVIDTGIGITESDLPNVFEPFVRGREVERKKYPGTGLGLALSKRLAKLLGGDVVLTKTEHGVGSVFTVTIAEAAKVGFSVAGLPTIPLAPANREPGGKIGGRLNGMRILVVDDVADNRILISRFLEAEGASVVTAAGGEEAVALGLQDGFHAVLMDLSMPDVSGQEATAQLRGKGYKVPIVALTAHAMREEKEKALCHGFDDYLTKPVVREVLIEALSKIHQIA